MRAATAVFATLLLVLAPTAALAQEGDQDRAYEVDVSETRAEIAIPGQYGDRTGETGVVFDTRKGQLGTDFTFEDVGDEAAPRLDVNLHELVEYSDENDNGYYDAQDEVASSWRIAEGSSNVTGDSNGTLAWDALEEKDVTSDDDVNGTQVRGVASFPSQDPLAGVLDQLGQGENRTFAVDVIVFGQQAELDNQTIGATQVMVDWTVNNYPYTQDDTQLALVASGDSATPVSYVEEDDSTHLGITQTLGDHAVALGTSLSDEATVDGNATEAQTARLEAPEDGNATDNETLVSVSYERGDTIAQDSILGSEVTESEGVIGSARDKVNEAPGLTAWFAIAGVAAAAGLLRRR